MKSGVAQFLLTTSDMTRPWLRRLFYRAGMAFGREEALP